MDIIFYILDIILGNSWVECAQLVIVKTKLTLKMYSFRKL